MQVDTSCAAIKHKRDNFLTRSNLNEHIKLWSLLSKAVVCTCAGIIDCCELMISTSVRIIFSFPAV